jgi:hypothetical protein
MERYIVSCYSAEDGGDFAAHRDNVQDVTAHRRFGISIDLNEEFEGGSVSFPEYNDRGLKVPPGWAVVFPCGILHAVSRVTRGRRYAFLPFVYDEEGAKFERNNSNSFDFALCAEANLIERFSVLTNSSRVSIFRGNTRGPLVRTVLHCLDRYLSLACHRRRRKLKTSARYGAPNPKRSG